MKTRLTDPSSSMTGVPRFLSVIMLFVLDALSVVPDVRVIDFLGAEIPVGCRAAEG